jgi:hypothetical protein
MGVRKGLREREREREREQVLLSGNVMRPCPSDPSKTEFTTVAHVNPGAERGEGDR